MKVFVAALTITSAVAFAPVSFKPRTASQALFMADEFDLDYGKKNSYVTQSIGDGGQGTFGAISPNEWRVAGTSPVGEVSYRGAPDGGEEPWFAEAISTVFLDLQKADDTLRAFTKDAAMFKIDSFAATSPYGFTTKEAALEELVGALGYSKFLETNDRILKKEWDKLHPEPKEPTE
mmetsp:Transcript_32404/g.49566  ORF Transcript_32404/g.49566 Transcript_32404/m.49566 type:complete len:177 (-) Transcript_32404:207-737(-)